MAVDHRGTSRSGAFAALVIALSLGAFVAFAAVFNLVPLVVERGFSPSFAAWTLGLGGAGQVLGRVGYLPLAARVGPRGRAVAVMVATALSTAVLGIVGSAAALILVAVGAGVVRGILILIQATAITERWGANALRPPQRPHVGTCRHHDGDRPVGRHSALLLDWELRTDLRRPRPGCRARRRVCRREYAQSGL